MPAHDAVVKRVTAEREAVRTTTRSAPKFAIAITALVLALACALPGHARGSAVQVSRVGIALGDGEPIPSLNSAANGRATSSSAHGGGGGGGGGGGSGGGGGAFRQRTAESISPRTATDDDPPPTEAWRTVSLPVGNGVVLEVDTASGKFALSVDGAVRSAICFSVPLHAGACTLRAL
jgi:hypothetical protein